MKNVLLFSAIAMLALPVVSHAADDAHGEWGYTGATAAKNWAKASEVCGNGTAQSPINITEYMKGDLPNIEVSYTPSPLMVANTGHTVQVDFDAGSYITVDGKKYDLLHLDFHTPSEHYLDGAPFPMEMHFMHKAEDGTFGIVSAMMKIGKANKVIQGIWDNAPASKGEKMVEGVAIDAASLFPDSLEYYQYTGSLTAPPCTEGVQWHVLKEPIELSQQQLVTFQNLFPVNARPVQARNERQVNGD